MLGALVLAAADVLLVVDETVGQVLDAEVAGQLDLLNVGEAKILLAGHFVLGVQGGILLARVSAVLLDGPVRRAVVVLCLHAEDDFGHAVAATRL